MSMPKAATSDIRTSNRDLATTQTLLTTWLEKTLGPGSSPTLSNLCKPGKTGMSSETLLFDVTWNESGAERSGSFVGRLPPPGDAFPVFPKYDFDLQVGVMRLVRKYTKVPAPNVLWYEPDPTPLGVPFFIMEQIKGEAPSDNPPYVFGGWLLDASPEEQSRVQEHAVATIASVHGIQAPAQETAFLLANHPGETPLRRHFAGEKAYYEWSRGGHRFPLIEQLFDWVEQHWPEDEGESVVCWGDARIGNMLWHDFTPTAVLDWEMATYGPREIDVAWTILLHKYFQAIAAFLGLPMVPMAGFMRRDDVVASYEKISGRKLKNMNFFLAYGLLRMALVDTRTAQRRILFGEMPEQEDLNNYLLCRALVEQVLQGEQDPWA